MISGVFGMKDETDCLHGYICPRPKTNLVTTGEGGWVEWGIICNYNSVGVELLIVNHLML